ncbi:SRPBCC family protein [Saccharopolyspora mangrovi]|uniref:SRPBCC family protein n=1 Tax=Saccharopolyspora mangrovi TaxID=3082379 RepID=A0ABU6A5B8_9PSEU|nr:SRPBCC family protein [Saccharopolyspora sp. S2-29]MEB3366647.1 SRPBCC family protein [Saccharopolyspora sp. S2-29]
MSAIEETIDVGVPVRTAYNQWTQFKSFPRFAAAVKKVDQLRPNVTRWMIGFGPLRRESEVEIVRQQPDRCVAWRSLERQPRHRGEVTFRPLGPERTEIVVRVHYEPRGLGESLAGAFGVPHRMVRFGLEHFKEFIESLGEESGGWRGAISKGRVQPFEPEPPRSQVPKWPTG